MSNALPNVEHSYFEFDESGMYWLDTDGVRHKVVNGGIYANGVRDLCIYWRGPRAGDIGLGKTAEIAKERILLIPKGDILWLNFEDVFYGDRRSVFIDIESDPRIKPMIRAMILRFGEKPGVDYAMFGGEKYLR